MTTSPSDLRLYADAERLDVVVTEGILQGRSNAHWYPEVRCVVLRIGLRYEVRRTCLGHELGHVEFGHPPGCDPCIYARQERVADEYAARILITRSEYKEAEAQHGPCVPALAHHLQVTEALVRTWRSMELRRIESES
ncbi:ImmA/IrrE family metallo-endopeptidase [Rhodococcus jostii]|uniref:ImmA/IrrE family metallo-endopeptidase n=1 Tax=Rhodococcus jostii TaxID=132919 RepID=UPI00363F134D